MSELTDRKFLREVQNAGWQIEAVTEGSCIGRCPTLGCSMRALMTPGKQIPQRVVSEGPSLDIPLQGYEHGRRVLKSRRRELALTIREVEEVSGIADDHIAKMEPEKSTRQPNAETFIEWAAALGYEVVLRPTDLPAITMAMIEETRKSEQDRQRRFALERQRDARPLRLGVGRVDRSGR